MVVATRGYHPLPFEHLEPKRFEDLVRQIAYEFRRWRQLEATGRGGADDGFDIRGFEIVHSEEESDEPGSDEDVLPSSTLADRLWLFQCKREKEMGPKKLVAYLDEIAQQGSDPLYGLIFVAPCNFSKTAFDDFRNWCIGHGIQEFQLWGRSNIEDMLFQPKNDHLLFAHFGISLRVRRQTAATQIRRVITLKRKLRRILDKRDYPGTFVLLRDVADERYPDVNDEDLKAGRYGWRVCSAMGLSYAGLLVLDRHHLAYYDPTSGQWDFASGVDRPHPQEREADPWRLEESGTEKKRRDDAWTFWFGLPDRTKYHMHIKRTLLFEHIVEIDDIGDDIAPMPTIYVEFRDGQPILSSSVAITLHPIESYMPNVELSIDGHVRVFPDAYRDVNWEQGWFARNNAKYATEMTILSTENKPSNEGTN